MTSGSTVLRSLRYARFSRLIRVIRVGAMLKSFADVTNSVMLLTGVRAFFYVLFVTMWVHISGCLWYLLGTRSQEGWANQHELTIFPLNYMVSVHWTAAQLQGNTDLHPTFSAVERGFATLQVLVSVIVLSLFVSKLTSTLHSLALYRSRMHEVERQASAYLEDHGISTGTSLRVRKYIQWKERTDTRIHNGLSEKDLMGMLPVDLRREVLEQARAPLLRMNPVLIAIHTLCMPLYRALCADVFELAEYNPGESVFWYGQVCNYLYFTTNGIGHYVKYGSVIRAFMQFGRTRRGREAAEFVARYASNSAIEVARGACMCEAGLWINWVHVGDCTPMTHLSVVTVSVAKFADRVASYPQVQMQLAIHAREFAMLLREWEISDLTTSGHLFEATELEQNFS